MPEVTLENFAALARSSPWLWRTIQFVATWSGPTSDTQQVRAWIDRPDGLRVETLDGRVLQADRQPRSASSSMTFTAYESTGDDQSADLPSAVSLGPDLNADGLVLRRPWFAELDDPMFENYAWVAMLDPAEFADGEEELGAEPAANPVKITHLSSVEHAHRQAWEAVLTPTDSYNPRCSCCALLYGERSVALAPFTSPFDEQADFRYADAYRVRLDVGTGICVFIEQIGGTRAGRGHDLRIESVDEPMTEVLFRE
jgi:hypothetical protein